MASNSVYNKLSRYVHGGNTEIGDLGLEWWDRRNIPTDPTDHLFTVDYFHAGRLDLIATIFYGEPRWWWIIAQVNNILDIQQEVFEGRQLAVPAKDRLMIIMNGKTGGFTSTREKNFSIISPVIV